MKPVVSVVMPAYNTERYLPQSIQSILDQTFCDFELIIVDDCSRDHSLDVMKDFARKDPRIRVISNFTNLGISKTVNRAMGLATGDFIARQDSDDYSLPQRLEKQYKFLMENPDFFLVGSEMLFFYEKESTFRREPDLMDEDAIRNSMPIKLCMSQPTFFFRNDGRHFYREKFTSAEDYDFLLRLLSEGKRIININDTLVIYRVRENSMSNGNQELTDAFDKKAREFYHQRFETGKDGYESFDPEPFNKLRRLK